jgi:hypothetical protein
MIDMTDWPKRLIQSTAWLGRALGSQNSSSSKPLPLCFAPLPACAAG